VPTTDTLNRETTLCISLAARPSNLGTRFHNHLYDELGLNYVYKAFAPTDIAAALAGIRGLGIRGAGVSMPYKEVCIPLLDELDQSAAVIGSVNTIVNTDGRLVGYNTDYLAVATALTRHRIPTGTEFLLRGSGGMGKAVVAALRDHGLTTGTIIARNERTGPPLAQQYGFGWAPELADRRAALLINVTPIGMAGGAQEDDLSFDRAAIEQAQAVFDVIAFPPRTPLIAAAEELGRATITGAEIIAAQAAEQFALYTGIRADDDQVRRASEFSRA
jgi:shikimate dehydrogenase